MPALHCANMASVRETATFAKVKRTGAGWNGGYRHLLWLWRNILSKIHGYFVGHDTAKSGKRNWKNRCRDTITSWPEASCIAEHWSDTSVLEIIMPIKPISRCRYFSGGMMRLAAGRQLKQTHVPPRIWIVASAWNCNFELGTQAINGKINQLETTDVLRL